MASMCEELYSWVRIIFLILMVVVIVFDKGIEWGCDLFGNSCLRSFVNSVFILASGILNCEDW